MLTYEEIVDRVMQALGTKRIKVRVPVPLLRPAVWLMQTVLPNPPATTTLLELLAVPNVIKEDGLAALGITPRAFTPENLSYMRHFTIGTTIGKFFGRAYEEEKVRQTAMGK